MDILTDPVRLRELDLSYWTTGRPPAVWRPRRLRQKTFTHQYGWCPSYLPGLVTVPDRVLATKSDGSLGKFDDSTPRNHLGGYR
jgi:hypothetical protein